MQTHTDEHRRMQMNAKQTASSVWADATPRCIKMLDVCSRTFGIHYTFKFYFQAHAQCVHACSTMSYMYTSLVSTLYCPTTTLVEHDNTVWCYEDGQGGYYQDIKHGLGTLVYTTPTHHTTNIHSHNNHSNNHTHGPWPSHRKVANFNVLHFNSLRCL